MNNRELTEYNSKRRIVQVGFASSDVKKTIKAMHDILGIGPWEIVTLTDENSCHVKIMNERVKEPFFVYVAHCNVGKTDFEVLAPIYGPNAYSKFIEERGAGLQHPKEKLAKEDLWDATLDGECAGAKLLLTGGIETDRFVYLDMQEMGAGIFELGNCPTDLELEKECWPNGDTGSLLEANKNRHITQIGYVAYDLRRVMRTLSRALKMGPWTIAELNEVNTKNFAVNGVKVSDTFSCRVAVTMIGDVQIEIVQPIAGLNPLFAYLERHGEGLHHIKEAMSIKSMHEFAKQMESKGYRTQISGEIGNEKFMSFSLEKEGISVYEVGGPTGYLDLEGLVTEIWP